MSSNKNDEAGAAAGMMGAGFVIIAGFLFGLLVFVAIIVSLLYLVSLVSGKEFTLWRDTYTPRGALITYLNGLIGIAVVLTFTAFICAFYELAFPRDWLLYLIAGGYSVGSLWLWMCDDDVEEPAPYIAPMHETRPVSSSSSAEKRFEYASWDDERGKP